MRIPQYGLTGCRKSIELLVVALYAEGVKVALSYVLALTGAGMVGYAVTLARALNCDYPAVRFRILQALRTQPWQAEMFTKTKPGSFFDGIHAAMKTAGTTGLRDPVQLAQVTRPSYDAATATVAPKWKDIFGKLRMGGMGIASGLALAIGFGARPTVHIVLLVAAIIAAIWAFTVKRDCERYVVLARLEILPDVDRAVAEGRYGKAPN